MSSLKRGQIRLIFLFPLVLSELKLDKRFLSPSIEYIVNVEMSLIRFSNDKSFHFYLKLKREDIHITAYALVDILHYTPTEHMLASSKEMVVRPNQYIDSRRPPIDMSTNILKLNDFISSIEISPVEVYDECIDELNGIVARGKNLLGVRCHAKYVTVLHICVFCYNPTLICNLHMNNRIVIDF